MVPDSGFVEDSAFGRLVAVSEAVFCGHVGVAAARPFALSLLTAVAKDHMDTQTFVLLSG